LFVLYFTILGMKYMHTIQPAEQPPPEKGRAEALEAALFDDRSLI
jgi:hypothetical protein